jgi:hypothetical protein
VKVKVAGEGPVVGRVLAAAQSGVTLDVNGVRRDLGYGSLGPGTVQVEFGPLPDVDELDQLADDELDEDEFDDEFGEDELADEFGGINGDPTDEVDLGAGGDGH